MRITEFDAFHLRELVELGVADILQPDMNHVAGITALWKWAAVAEAAGSRWRLTRPMARVFHDDGSVAAW